jgi:hypothetical protein
MNNGGIPNHGYTHWWTMFNPRQLLAQAQLLRGILPLAITLGVLERLFWCFPAGIRYRNMFCFWDINYDKLVPHMSNNNYHPKTNVVEGSYFGIMGSGRWSSCADGVIEGIEWGILTNLSVPNL